MSTSLLSHLDCAACGQRAGDGAFSPCTACGGPLRCRYDLAGLDAGGLPDPPRGGDAGVFRWSALLPVRDPARRLTLGEGGTPVLPLPKRAAELGLAALWVKDEGAQAWGSCESRGMAVAMAAHAERGAKAVTLPAAGHEAGVAALYARAHGLSCRVVLPAAAGASCRAMARLAQARVIAVSGDWGVASDWIREHPAPHDDHVLAPFHEPFRLEGLKTLAFEIWERFRDELPDVVVHPTGSGAGIVALHAGFALLREAGLLRGAPPRLVAAQVDACAPVARAFEAGSEDVTPWEASRRTLAEGLRVPRVAGGRLVLAALRDGGGAAAAVSEGALLDALRGVATSDGFVPCAEGAAAFAALERLAPSLAGARVLVLNTGSVHLSPETLAAAASG